MAQGDRKENSTLKTKHSEELFVPEIKKIPQKKEGVFSFKEREEGKEKPSFSETSLSEKQDYFQPGAFQSPSSKKEPSLIKSEIRKKIERILEENIGEIYLNLSPEEQRKFKARGEETASKIEELFQKAKVRVKKILSLMKRWLKGLPGVNRFFLEQEAKIKTDKIIGLLKK